MPPALDLWHWLLRAAVKTGRPTTVTPWPSTPALSPPAMCSCHRMLRGCWWQDTTLDGSQDQRQNGAPQTKCGLTALQPRVGQTTVNVFTLYPMWFPGFLRDTDL